MKKVVLNTKFMLGIDGPNVNLLFQNKLCNEFCIIHVGTCPLHNVNSALGKAVKSLKESVVDLYGMTIDFCFSFKYSAGHSEQYTACHEITGVNAKMLEKHCET